MRVLLRTLLILAALVAYTGMDFPNRYGIQFPRQPGPRFDHQVRRIYIDALDQNRPELVVLGDSSLPAAVDEDRLAELTGKGTFNIGIEGSASAFWYLVIKNNIAAAQHKPGYLLIVFRDTILTAPGYRVQGSYFTRLDEFTYRNEPILRERAYINLMNPLEFAAEKYWPLYGTRLEARRDIDAAVRYRPPAQFGCDQACTDEGMYQTFGGADLEPGQLRAAIAAAEQYLYTPAQLNFKSQVDASFLPEMIRLTKENGIQLILVRLKSYSPGTGDFQSQALKNYITDLEAYLTENDVPFLDFGADPRLKSEYFADPIHLNNEGRQLFTMLLADALASIPD